MGKKNKMNSYYLDMLCEKLLWKTLSTTAYIMVFTLLRMHHGYQWPVFFSIEYLTTSMRIIDKYL